MKANVNHEFDGNFVVSKEPTCVTSGQKYAYCEYCKAFVYVDIDKTEHKDTNKDNKCDVCSAEIIVKDEAEGDSGNTGTETNKCTCNCHKSGIAKIFFNIVLFFQKLFGINKECVCGAAHY